MMTNCPQLPHQYPPNINHLPGTMYGYNPNWYPHPGMMQYNPQQQDHPNNNSNHPPENGFTDKSFIPDQSLLTQGGNQENHVNNQENKFKDAWIADSGASHHMTNSPVGMFNTKPASDTVQVGDGKTIPVEYIGDVQGQVTNSDGTMVTYTLKEVSYIPSMC